MKVENQELTIFKKKSKIFVCTYIILQEIRRSRVRVRDGQKDKRYIVLTPFLQSNIKRKGKRRRRKLIFSTNNTSPNQKTKRKSLTC